MVFGDDFYYSNAFLNYDNMDDMINYINKKYGEYVTFKYSTPSDYIDAVKKYNVNWSVKTDDGFPYSDKKTVYGKWGYWVGYFTSRPNSKEYFKYASSHYHSIN